MLLAPLPVMDLRLELTADEQRALGYLNEEERAVYFEQLMALAHRDLTELFTVVSAPVVASMA